MPKVSIAISSCNSAAYLLECLTQLVDQSIISDCEIIVIDSGSDQDEASVCREFASKFGSFIYERTPRETLYAAWNRALKIASGEFFVNANTDDALHPDALRILSEALVQNPDAAIAYGDWIWSGIPNANFPWDESFRRIRHESYHPSLPLFYAYAGCHQFWRKSKLQSIGGFNAERIAAGDYEALCRIVPLRVPAVYVPMAVSGFYQNPKGLSRASDISRSEFVEIRDAFRKNLNICDLFAVSEEDSSGCADAWATLAQRALDIRVPWDSESVGDAEYAEECARMALTLDPKNRDARDILESLKSKAGARSRGSFIDQLLGKLRKKSTPCRGNLLSPSRISSPVFYP